MFGQRSLKGVLLHNGNVFGSVPVAYSVILKELCANLQLLLLRVNCSEHNWQVCGDFKVLTMLLGQQSGFTKFPCFLCLWDSRARVDHWTKKDWPPRENLDIGSKNVVRQSLVSPSKVVLPPLHIKLGLMKEFVKALNKEGNCFKYICEKFLKLSEAKWS